VPTSTLSKRSITSGMFMRTQPCDAALPIEPTSEVPWKPAPP
jgi:hypothetical protein